MSQTLPLSYGQIRRQRRPLAVVSPQPVTPTEDKKPETKATDQLIRPKDKK